MVFRILGNAVPSFSLGGLILGTGICLGQTSDLPYYMHKSFSPSWEDRGARSLTFTGLQNQLGQQISSRDWQGKITVLNFFFTGCPGLCDLLMKQMAKLRKELPEEVRLVSMSVDPETDRPKVLRSYQERYPRNSYEWHLVTGKKSVIYNLARAYFFAENTLKSDEAILHNEMFYLLDHKLRIRGIYNGTLPRSRKDIQSDVRSLLSSNRAN
ncbi:SCO family protein [Pseudobacteriovorax antillogorgiicola]|uniref:Protein SCO1/2 n=1 Tax=Pseudobacteriovorax antillogorgiicola TaxID=1513793 RepID=A0A1Y6CDH5_9BACT|nr:SCO family protein [Pseudobacteriovorax antillogorgiicola]TCS47948.1 protein SCO1/2 [Pseudobacteriovorax antillogorgiicola]SMF58115.1 protein SCO1/2 [Pseudobacteriovorax antillogorgiicola]